MLTSECLRYHPIGDIDECNFDLEHFLNELSKLDVVQWKEPSISFDRDSQLYSIPIIEWNMFKLLLVRDLWDSEQKIVLSTGNCCENISLSQLEDFMKECEEFYE